MATRYSWSRFLADHDPARYNIKSMVPSYGLLLFILILNEGRNTS